MVFAIIFGVLAIWAIYLTIRSVGGFRKVVYPLFALIFGVLALWAGTPIL